MSPESEPDVAVSAFWRAIPGTVYLVGAGPGDPGLLTLRGAELLGTADVVLHDELVHPALLELARGGAEVRSVGKRGGAPASKNAKQEVIDEELVALARAGKSVVRLKGGDPFLFGRGSEEAEALAAAGVPFEVVPGVCSPLGAAAYAGISLTHRDFASSVTFVSAATKSGRMFDWRELSSVQGTICVLMGMREIERVVSGLIELAGRDPATPAAVIQWGTRSSQRVVEGRLDGVAEAARALGLGSPGLIVVGAVASLRERLRWFDRRPLFGKRVLLLRPREQVGATARLVRSRGGEPVVWSAIEVVDPPDGALVLKAARELGRYDVVAFTSENGVSRLWRALDGEGLDARAFGAARVAAIGPGTAAALLGRGVRADIVPAEFLGEALAEAILNDPAVAGRLGGGGRPRVLIPRAKVAREVLPERLRAAGCDVDVVPVYETRSASPASREELIRLLSDRAVDIVFLTASSTADSLADALGDRAADLLSGVLLASIGPITTKTASRRGLSVSVTSGVSTTAGLIEAVELHLAGV